MKIRKTNEGKLTTGLKGKTLFDLTAEERAEYDQYKEKYFERFKKKFAGAIMAQVDYGERVTQCLPPYPPYWFVSEHGKVFSVKGAKLKRLKPFKVHEFKKIERFKLRAPYGDVFLYRVVADHFCSDEFVRLSPDEPVEVHHEDPYSENRDWAEKLKRLPKSIHEGATKAQKHPTAEKMEAYYQENIRKALEENPDIPQFTCDLTPILEYICKFAETHAGVAYHTGADGSCRVEFIPPQGNNKPDSQQEQDEQTQEPDGQQD